MVNVILCGVVIFVLGAFYYFTKPLRDWFLGWIKWVLKIIFSLLLLYCIIFTIYLHYAPIDMNQLHYFLNYRDQLYSYGQITIPKLDEIIPSHWDIVRGITHFLEYIRS